MIRIWGRATSANVQKPMWLIGELALDHERLDVGGPFGGLDSPEFLALNPNGLIPVMRDDNPVAGASEGVVLWESTAILRYLGEIYGDDALWPIDAARRARIDMWIDWTNTTWVPAMTQVFNAFVRTPRANRNPAAVRRVVGAASTIAARADAALSDRGHLAEDGFTLADVAFGVLLYRYYTLEFQRPPTPHLDRYYASLTERAPYRQHAMIDYETLRVPGAERSA